MLSGPDVLRLLQRIEHEVGVHRTAHAPADDAARVPVDDEKALLLIRRRPAAAHRSHARPGALNAEVSR